MSVRNEPMEECPICGKLDHFSAMALSRKDNKTMICSECGTREALEEFTKYMSNKDNVNTENK